PQDVGVAVPVKVADSLYAITGAWGSGATLAQNCGTAHEPDPGLSRCAVLPQDIGLAISVEIADALNAPLADGAAGAARAAAARYRGPVHEPDPSLPCRRVFPQNVCLAIPIEVADTENAP